VKKFAPLFITLLLLLSVSIVQSQEQSKTESIQSYGEVYYETVSESSTELWWGAVVSDTAWEICGSYFGKTQIDIMKESGATAVRIMLDKHAWDTRDNRNNLGIPYPDYIRLLVEWSKPELRVYLDLTRDSSMEPFESAEKKQVIETPDLRTAWIEWGKEVISYCSPDAIGVMNEPHGTSFEYYYDNFVSPSIEAYSSIDPNISIFVMSNPFHDIGAFVSRPINNNKVIYEFHIYYIYPVNPEEVSELQFNLMQAYGEGRLEEARDYLFEYLNWKFGTLPKDRINIAECGIWNSSLPNWKVFMQDLYDYAKEYQIHGLLQYAFSKGNYLMLDPSTSYTILTEYGQFWADNCPV
jgi:hypothetical protein